MSDHLTQLRDELREALSRCDEREGRGSAASVSTTEKLLFVLRLLGRSEIDEAAALQIRLLEHYERSDPMPVVDIAEQLLGLATLHLMRPETASKAGALASRVLGLADAVEDEEPEVADQLRARAHGITARMHVALKHEEQAREAHLESLELLHARSAGFTAIAPGSDAAAAGGDDVGGAERELLEGMSWTEFRAHRSKRFKL